MSTKAKLTLGSSIVFTISIVTYIHYVQKKEREGARQGVIRYVEQEARKKENLAVYDENEKFIKAMKEIQAKDQEKL